MMVTTKLCSDAPRIVANDVSDAYSYSTIFDSVIGEPLNGKALSYDAEISLNDLKTCTDGLVSPISHSYSDCTTKVNNNYGELEYLDNKVQYIDTGIQPYSDLIANNDVYIKFVNGRYIMQIRTDNKTENKKGEEEMLKVLDPVIIRYEIIKPDKVVEVEFANKHIEKMVCHEDDVFDIRKCLFIAIAKYLYKDTYTWEGIEYMAQQLSYQKMYVKIVDKALKAHARVEKEMKKLKEKEQAKKDALANKKRKHARYVERRKQRRLNEQAKAICEGLKMYDEHQEEKLKIARETYCDTDCERC